MYPIFKNLYEVLQNHITSPFGQRIDPITKKLGGHNGVDLGGNPAGTEILAPYDWSVLSMYENDLGGIQLVLSHAKEGVRTGYAHLTGYVKGLNLRSKGSAGALIGYLGNTGKHTTAAHLHFTYMILTSSNLFTAVDPVPYLKKSILEKVDDYLQPIPLLLR
jgi:murein DD-endopeptidase MepM/ murein hydrolase activator NlpD